MRNKFELLPLAANVQCYPGIYTATRNPGPGLLLSITYGTWIATALRASRKNFKWRI